jgi:hypothetical protein
VVVHQVVHGGFGRKSNERIASDTEQMKNTPIRVCVKIAFVNYRYNFSPIYFQALLGMRNFHKRRAVCACANCIESGPQLPKV